MFERENRIRFRFGNPTGIEAFPTLRDVSPEHLAEALAAAKQAFAADLQWYRDLVGATPMEDLLKELEEIQRRYRREPPRAE
jgi:hypothetical protein